MALGVTQQLPIEERHIYQMSYIQDSLVVRLGGRISEELVFGMISTGANNDLVGCTELARKMVREWGMSERVGPMAWGSQGMVFLGDDLMHSRDYSEETARVIDEEVERILRQQEDRCRVVLKEHRGGLDLVAKALLEKETIDGAEVRRLVDQAAGREVRPPLPEPVGVEVDPPEVSTNGDGPVDDAGRRSGRRRRRPGRGCRAAQQRPLASVRGACPRTPRSDHRITAERPPALSFLNDRAALSRFTTDAAVALEGPAWLRARRAAAAERFAATNLPTEAEEIWRYSRVSRIDLDSYSPVNGAAKLERRRAVDLAACPSSRSSPRPGPGPGCSSSTTARSSTASSTPPWRRAASSWATPWSCPTPRASSTPPTPAWTPSPS